MNVFIKTFFIVTAIFIVGIFIGTFIDLSGTTKIRGELEMSNVDLSDILAQSRYFDIFGSAPAFCDISIRGNIQFADAMYRKGLEIEKAEYTNRFSPFLYYEKQKYILSKVQFWLNAIILREKCNASYATLAYFYTRNASISTEADQQTQSAVLEALKNICGNKLLLIPIQLDLNLTVVNMITSQYNIKYTPAILINENVTLHGVQSLNALTRYVDC